MSDFEFIKSLSEVENIIEVINLIAILLGLHYINAKILNKKDFKIKHVFAVIINIVLITLFIIISKSYKDLYTKYILLIISIALFNYIINKNNIIKGTLISVISVTLNYAIYYGALMLSVIPNIIFRIQNNYIALATIVFTHYLLIYLIFKIKKFKNGISFLRDKIENSYFSILILNMGIMVLFFRIIIKNYIVINQNEIVITFITSIVLMIITIKESLQLYYKQNLLTKDLDATKKELEDTKQELEIANKESMESGKRIHTVVHKIDTLEFNINKLINSDSLSNEEKEKLKAALKDIKQEMYQAPDGIELTKTEINLVDSTLESMQNKCIKENITFELQVVGNVRYMVNNLISESDLQTLLSDHIKDAIIAINNSENSNRSILVRIGKIDNVYGLYIYDSGIEFTPEVLEKLGKEPITTHKDTGGTGMGFMNTFDTLRKCNASLYIKEIGKPVVDNYTKAVIIKFNNLNEFKVETYKTLETV